MKLTVCLWGAIGFFPGKNIIKAMPFEKVCIVIDNNLTIQKPLARPTLFSEFQDGDCAAGLGVAKRTTHIRLIVHNEPLVRTRGIRTGENHVPGLDQTTFPFTCRRPIVR